MKILILTITLFLSPFLTDEQPIQKIPPGRYLLQYDDEYSSSENLSVFTLEYDRFIMKFPDKLEDLEVQWIDEDSFIVKGFTESINPSSFESDLLKTYRSSFNIVKEGKDEYYFVVGSQEKRDTILTGKFTKLQ